MSHNLKKLQIRNGTYLIPSEPIESTGTGSGSSGTNVDGSNVPFLVETLKAWGRLHDASLDAGLYACNMVTD